MTKSGHKRCYGNRDEADRAGSYRERYPKGCRCDGRRHSKLLSLLPPPPSPLVTATVWAISLKVAVLVIAVHCELVATFIATPKAVVATVATMASRCRCDLHD